MRIVTTFHTSVHVNDKELLPPHKNCLFCDGPGPDKTYPLQDDPQVWLLKCSGCGAASASRLPTADALDRVYASYYKSGLVSHCDQRITFDNVQRLARHLARKIQKYGRFSKIRMLDYGGGDGTVAVWTAAELLRKGADHAEITVVDYNRELVSPESKDIVIEHSDSIHTLPQESYDFVIASAVLEHIPEPKDAMLSLASLLRDEGFFYARTPFVAPLIKIFGRVGKWDHNFPAHIHDLGQDFWEHCFSTGLYAGRFALLESRPSLVQTTFRHYFLRTLLAYVLKAPWYLLRRHYNLVGGWEIFARKLARQ